MYYIILCQHFIPKQDTCSCFLFLFILFCLSDCLTYMYVCYNMCMTGAMEAKKGQQIHVGLELEWL